VIFAFSVVKKSDFNRRERREEWANRFWERLPDSIPHNFRLAYITP
jgi:hypothetical protein